MVGGGSPLRAAEGPNRGVQDGWDDRLDNSESQQEFFNHSSWAVAWQHAPEVLQRLLLTWGVTLRRAGQVVRDETTKKGTPVIPWEVQVADL